MRVISLSWGRQSFALAAMAATGEIPAVDVALFADTDHERDETYEFEDTWAPWLRKKGLAVERVIGMDTRIIQHGRNGASLTIPAFTTDGNGSRGQLRRQCTQDWKVAPMRRWLQANRKKQPVELLLGISLDEYRRMRQSDVKYITHRWPLVDLRLTREDCAKWLELSGLKVPPKSSCVFCPYHDNQTWRELQSAEARQGKVSNWTRALDVDRFIRKARPPFDLFLHQARKPLEQVDLRPRRERNITEQQISFWENECMGICGV